MSDGNDLVYWYDGKHWTLGAAPIPDTPGSPIPGGVWYCGVNTMHMTEAGTEGKFLASHGAGETPTWELPPNDKPLVPVWITPPLLNGWLNYAAGWEVAGVRKHLDGTGELKGLLKLGTRRTAMFVIPDGLGLRPPVSVPRTVSSGNGYARVDINPSGSVIVNTYFTGGSNAFVSLSGIRYSLT